MKDKAIFTAVGLMSGTSLDGVDAALIETDGRGQVAPKGFLTIPYTAEEREVIRAAFGARDRGEARVIAAEKIVTERHIDAVKALLRQEDVAADAVDVIGFHGQTIFHAPKDGMTIQIGDGGAMARECKIDVVDDFRSADVKTGGEGAPLAPVYHAARVRHSGIEPPVVVLNIGGVANVTWIGEGADDIIAFDTGPGNALMDDWVKTRTGALYDKDGAMAAAGTPVQALLDQWYAHEYFTRKPPKSLDRDQWDIAALGPMTQGMDSISNEDGAATLLRFTGDMIVRAAEHMPVQPNTWYACGGGRHNAALMAYLNERLSGAVLSVDDLGWNGDATEAECFAYLAVRSVLDLPLSFPGTTGVKQPVCGGVLHKSSSLRETK